MRSDTLIRRTVQNPPRITLDQLQKAVLEHFREAGKPEKFYLEISFGTPLETIEIDTEQAKNLVTREIRTTLEKGWESQGGIREINLHIETSVGKTKMALSPEGGKQKYYTRSSSGEDGWRLARSSDRYNLPFGIDLE